MKSRQKYLIVLAVFFGLICPTLNAQNQQNEVKTSRLSIGETLEFKSKILDQNRAVNVYLPVGYHPDSAKTYPVIYLLDGSLDEDFIHISGLTQFGSFSWINMLPETIVVGIVNIDRKHDLTYPSKNELDQKEFPTTGGSELFIQMIAKELKPIIQEQYKVNMKSTLIGQSLGGLLATEILFKQPDLFNNYIIVSPSLWWDDGALLEVSPMPYKGDKKIFVAVGKEGKIMKRSACKLYKKLSKTSDKSTTQLGFLYLKNRDHGDALHISVYRAFEAFSKK